MRLIQMLKDVSNDGAPVWIAKHLYPIVEQKGNLIKCKTENDGQILSLDAKDLGVVFEVEWCSGQRGRLKECLRCAGCAKKEEKQ